MTVVPPLADATAKSDAGQPLAPAAPAPETAVQTKREADFIEATRLSKAGTSISRVARLLGVDRKTLRNWLKAGTVPSWQQPPRGRMIDGHLAYMEKRWADGCCNATLLWRELTALGFKGRYTVVKTWAGQRRSVEMKAAGTAVKSSIWSLPSVSRTACPLLAGNAIANTTDATFVAGLLAKVPALADTVAAARFPTSAQKQGNAH